MTLKKIARHCSLQLLTAGSRKRRWTPAEKLQWTKAFNALQRLSGCKTLHRRGRLTSQA